MKFLFVLDVDDIAPHSRYALENALLAAARSRGADRVAVECVPPEQTAQGIGHPAFDGVSKRGTGRSFQSGGSAASPRKSVHEKSSRIDTPLAPGA